MVRREQIMGLVRHGLTFIGGFLVAKGLATEGQTMDMVGMAITTFASVWSVLSNKS
jgi:hypothetical protein